MSAVVALDALADDLRTEQDALDGVVADLPDIPGAGWNAPTPSPGWTVRDQIGHLTYFDATAAMAISEPDSFVASRDALLATGGGMDEMTLEREVAAGELVARWRHNRGRLVAAAALLDAADRIPWYGPPMGARSFLTARLMETWAHGQDIADAVGAHRRPSDRLRHIAQLGFITRGWSYAVRGEQQPDRAVRLELVAPSGAIWIFGGDDAPDLVRGTALDFCLVVTQRRHVDDTGLHVTGHAARDWLVKAQAFAGPATDGPPPRNESPSLEGHQ